LLEQDFAILKKIAVAMRGLNLKPILFIVVIAGIALKVFKYIELKSRKNSKSEGCRKEKY
jgi:hypothetical protein